MPATMVDKDTVQSIQFSKAEFPTEAICVEWLRVNGFSTGLTHESAAQWTFCEADADLFKRETIDLIEYATGIEMVVGERKPESEFKQGQRLIQVIESPDVKLDASERDVIIARISSDVVDRGGHMLNQKGVRLQDYFKNPVVLHQHDGEQRVGRNLWIRKQKDRSDGRTYLIAATKVAPDSVIGQEILIWLRAGMPLATSIGWQPLKWHRPDKDEIKARPDLVEATIFDEWELFEYSFVSVPMNQDAVVTGLHKGLKPATFGAIGVDCSDFDLLKDYVPPVEQKVSVAGTKRVVRRAG